MRLRTAPPPQLTFGFGEWREPPKPICQALNPKGRMAKDLEMSLRAATWLAHLCSLWLQFHNDNLENARRDEPSYDLPKSYPQAQRFNQARKECGAWSDAKAGNPGTYRFKNGRWTRKNRPLRDVDTRPVYIPPTSARWTWKEVFDYWWDGRLERNIKELAENLPEENQERILEEMLK